MTANNVFAGARWCKFDFHTHTPASVCGGAHAWKEAKDTDDEVTPEQWLLKFMEAGIDCVAVTDHNTGEWVDELKAAYQRLEETRPDGFRPFCLFPGVEITVSRPVYEMLDDSELQLTIFPANPQGGQE